MLEKQPSCVLGYSTLICHAGEQVRQFQWDNLKSSFGLVIAIFGMKRSIQNSKKGIG